MTSYEGVRVPAALDEVRKCFKRVDWGGFVYTRYKGPCVGGGSMVRVDIDFTYPSLQYFPFATIAFMYEKVDDKPPIRKWFRPAKAHQDEC